MVANVFSITRSKLTEGNGIYIYILYNIYSYIYITVHWNYNKWQSEGVVSQRTSLKLHDVYSYGSVSLISYK